MQYPTKQNFKIDKQIYNKLKNVALHLILFFLDFLIKLSKKPLKKGGILLIRMDNIGDYLLFRNFIEILKLSAKYNRYSITLCGNIAFKDLAELLDGELIGKFIWIDRNKFIREFAYRFKMMREVRSLDFEVAIQPRYSREFLYDDAITRVSTAREKIGSVGDLTNTNKFLKTISDRFYTELVNARKGELFEFYRNREFFENILNTRLEITKPSLPKVSSNFLSKIGVKEKGYAVLFPGAGPYGEYRKWNAVNFAKVASFIVTNYDLKILTAGNQDDIFTANEIIHKVQTKGSMINITGKTKLHELIEVIAKAKVLISNETLAVHIAAITETLTICVSNGSAYNRFHPYPPEISKSIYYLYPEDFLELKDKLDWLRNKSFYFFKLNINSIDASKAIDLIKMILISP